MFVLLWVMFGFTVVTNDTIVIIVLSLIVIIYHQCRLRTTHQY